MKTPSALLLAGTLLVAGSAALLARVLLAPPPPPPVVDKPVEAIKPDPVYPPVLVAARDLRPGDFIDASALDWKPSDSEVDERLYYTHKSEATSLTGASVRHPVAAGSPLTSAQVVKPNEPGFVATIITPGMRAITIPTNQTATQYGMLASGNRVDVLINLIRELEQDVSSAQSSDLAKMLGADLPDRSEEQRQRMVQQVVSIQAQNQVPRLATQTLLQNVRVLSINNQVRSPLQPRPADATSTKKNPEAYPNSSPETVTLEVPSAYAERIALASQIGTLQLALRSSQEAGDGLVKPGSGQVTTLAQTTGVYNASAPFASQRPLVKTFHGDASNTVQFDYQ